MILLADLIARIRVQHEQASAVRWTDADITEAINEGLETLAEATHFYERYTTIPFSACANRNYINLEGFVPETVVRITSIYNSNRTEWLRPVSPNLLPYDWTQSVGEPQVFFTRGANWLGLWPRNDGTTGYLRVHYSGVPVRVANTTEVILRDLPDNHLPALELYALYELAAQDRESKRAVQLFGKYKERERRLKMYIDGRRSSGDSPGVIHSMGA